MAPLLVVLCAVVVVVMVGLAWWLQRDFTGRTGPPDTSQSLEASPSPSRRFRPVVDRPRRVSLVGSLVDADGQPVAGAQVIVVPDGQTLLQLQREQQLDAYPWPYPVVGPLMAADTWLDELPAALTDASGRFSLMSWWVAAKPVEPGDKASDSWRPALLAIADGLVPDSRALDCTVTNPESDALDIDLGRIVLQPAGSVSGRVVDEQGRPLEGVDVELIGPRLVRPSGDAVVAHRLSAQLSTARSDAEGRFVVPNVAPVSVIPKLRPVGRAQRILPAVSVVAGQRLELGEIVLPLGAAITGRVIDAESQPVPGAMVSVNTVIDYSAASIKHRIHAEWGAVMARHQLPPGLVTQHLAGHGWTLSDEQGRFALGGLEVGGSYDLLASAPGHEPVRLANIAVGSHDVQLPLPPRGVLTLRFLDRSTKAPVEVSELRAYRHVAYAAFDHEVPLPVEQGDEPDLFLVDQVCAADVLLAVTSPTHGRATVVVEGLAGEELSAKRQVPLALGSSLVGRVVDHLGVPLAGAQVRAERSHYKPGADYLPVAEQQPDHDGRFRLIGLQSGGWRLRVMVDGYVAASQDIVLAPGITQDLGDVQLQRADRR